MEEVVGQGRGGSWTEGVSVESRRQPWFSGHQGEGALAV